MPAFDQATLRRHIRRNLRGIEREKAGRVDQAVRLHETNVDEEFDGDQSYNRLRIIYTRRGDYESALRACRRAVTALDRWPEKAARFRAHVEKLEAR